MRSKLDASVGERRQSVDQIGTDRARVGRQFALVRIQPYLRLIDSDNKAMRMALCQLRTCSPQCRRQHRMSGDLPPAAMLVAKASRL